MKRRIKPPKDDRLKPWEPRPISLDRWRKHRDDIMAWEKSPGHRPEEWWCYERQMERPDSEDEAGILYEMGELTEKELAFLMPFWRQHYDTAWEPDFAIYHCWGDPRGDCTKGAASGREHLRWAGVPRAILEKWDAERRRRAKVIRKLAKVAT
jgi:hypothetical protein